ncbi:MAG TPA: bifunctional phosphoribosyl-AMP cyclohydrolase/phosphoribosyl-ATP diphosphatase HisIE [Saprospiraceae bacterium]|nr:bifunctional phosphoribosyl-AMP cyclohydrolase/phosphoribosyl-ATP diphosphatase HisIE [Saprospiraceae bacterium]
MRALDIENIKYDAVSGLNPAIIQDCITGKVLMLGYMNRAAIDKTLEEGKVTFFSRSKDRLWTKGESSENYLILSEIAIDCDLDALLIKALPQGPTCHTGDDTCWQEENSNGNTAFLDYLEQVITDRKNNESDQSYTSSLFKKGINKIAQKVGEEAVEIVIEAKDNNDDLFLGEAADLLFHYLVLLQAKNFKLADVIKVLEGRHGK